MIVKAMTAFVRAAARVQGAATGNEFLESILAERPDLRDQPVYFPTQGAIAHTVFIGDEVFKGPLWKGDAFSSFNKDIECLKPLQGKGIDVVPKITSIGTKSAFFSMTRMKGVVLADVLKDLSQDEKRALAKDIVAFFIDLAKALPTENGKYARHGDMQPGNVMIDPETKKLTGIIDFGFFEHHARDDLGKLPLRTRLCYGRSGLVEMIEEEFAAQKEALPNLPVTAHGKGARPRKLMSGKTAGPAT